MLHFWCFEWLIWVVQCLMGMIQNHRSKNNPTYICGHIENCAIRGNNGEKPWLHAAFQLAFAAVSRSMNAERERAQWTLFG